MRQSLHAAVPTVFKGEIMSIKSKVLGGILRYVGGKMDGKKSYAGAIGKILTGIASICGGTIGLIGTVYPDLGLPKMDAEASIATISAGVYAISSGVQGIGLAHKMEKSNVKP